MRIIAGRFGGQTLQSPPGHLTRPSTARTRESLFSLVDSRIYIEDAEVLDLFCGTGALGLEAISRGASLVTFVEQDPEVLDYARQNAEKLGVEDRCIFISGDAVEYLRRYSGPELDLIMADPPYKLEAMREIPDLAVPHLDVDGVLTLEHSTHDWFDDHPRLMTSRPYGRTVVSIFRPPLPPKDDDAAGEDAAGKDTAGKDAPVDASEAKAEEDGSTTSGEAVPDAPSSGDLPPDSAPSS